MKKIIFALIVATMFCACSNSQDAERVLQENGFTNIQTTGYSFFACGKDDFFSTGFTATSVNGSQVSGTVCSGLLFKGSTIRF